jgi:anti-anti-sigma factor
MIPQGMELRPALTSQSDALALGFAGEHIPDAIAVRSLSALIDYVETIPATSAPRLVVVDMRNVESLSTAALGKLQGINKRLSQARWRLLLIVDDPVVRGVIASTGLDRFVKLASSAELGETASNQPAADFTEAELAEMLAAGHTLDDAIRAIERLRG